MLCLVRPLIVADDKRSRDNGRTGLDKDEIEEPGINNKDARVGKNTQNKLSWLLRRSRMNDRHIKRTAPYKAENALV